MVTESVVEQVGAVLVRLAVLVTNFHWYTQGTVVNFFIAVLTNTFSVTGTEAQENCCVTITICCTIFSDLSFAANSSKFVATVTDDASTGVVVADRVRNVPVAETAVNGIATARAYEFSFVATVQTVVIAVENPFHHRASIVTTRKHRTWTRKIDFVRIVFTIVERVVDEKNRNASKIRAPVL